MVFFYCLVFIYIFFSLSLFGLVFNYSGNLFSFLIFFEACMLCLIVDFVVVSLLLDDFRCLVYALVLLSIAAVESAVGLSLILLYQRLRNNVLYNYKMYG